jgi:prophage tail gpP-like protein
MAARFELLCDGEIYGGWKEMRVTRSLEKASADFELTVSERWPIEGNAWQIFPGTACRIELEGDLVLTGFVDRYEPALDAGSHDVTCAGRSKTLDFVDCSITGVDGQFKGMLPGDLAILLAKPFGVEVVIEHPGTPIDDAQVQQGETAFQMLERLTRLQELLITDDAEGRLVLTRAGAEKSSSTLVQGGNLLTLASTHDDSERFSDYIVKAQRPADKTKDDWDDVIVPRIPPGLGHGARFALERAAGSKKKTKPKALTEVIGTIKDDGVKRYRPKVLIAEGKADDAEAFKRADWEMRRRRAHAKKASVSVVGWHQEDGTLWKTNQMIWIKAPYLGLDREMLISQVTFTYGAGGELAELDLVMPDVFLPDAKRKTAKSKEESDGGGGDGDGKGGGGMWGDVLAGSGNV